ncbi:hypothetical protein JZ751_021569 [Albula glossodonta]|uniref:Uncharacterized protein n=1 Tax=Albula glossodonta TaxID=121402 RepID=A0A8T2NLA8_9TELE|nr:hypothetical protein JZ751_021569 [Albula glossodonta]
MAFLEAHRQLRTALTSGPPSGDEARTERQGDEEQDRASVTSEHTIHTTEEKQTEEDTDCLVNRSQNSQEGGPEQDGVVPDPEPIAPQPPASPPRLKTTIYMETVQFLLQNNALQMAQRALAQQLLCPDGGSNGSYHLALARLQLLNSEFCLAEASLEKAVNSSLQHPDVWAFSGHLHYLTGNYGKAEMCYERTLDFVTDASDTHPIYFRLGDIYLQKGQLGELSEAEDALIEANALNNANPEVWGYLSLVCLRLDLQKEALLREITQLQDQVGFGDPSFRTKTTTVIGQDLR